MKFIDDIYSLVWDIADFFYQLSRDAQDIPIVGWAISTGFYEVYRGFWWMLTPIAHWWDFAYLVSSKIEAILTYSDIASYFRDIFDAALDSWGWVANAWNNILTTVDTWWGSTSLTVLAWVDEAKNYAAALVASVNDTLTKLQAAWDNFKGRIPTIDDIIHWYKDWTASVLAAVIAWGALTAVQISDLIDSALKSYEPFWADWQDWRDKVIEFFSDPEEWLYKAADRIIERFW